MAAAEFARAVSQVTDRFAELLQSEALLCELDRETRTETFWGWRLEHP